MFINTSKRFAFTMIELIFAIVIIAIAVLSLPMITQATQRGIEDGIVQEAIFAASAELIGATAGYWDENSMQDSNTSDGSRVINNIADVMDCNIITQRRPGHVHRRCLDNNATSPDDNTTTTDDFFDLNNAAVARVLYTDNTTDETGYKTTYNSTVAVQRDVNSSIKNISVTITDTNGNNIVVLRAQSANIGEVELHRRSF